MTKRNLAMLVSLMLIIPAAGVNCSSTDSSAEGGPCVQDADCQANFRCINKTCMTKLCVSAADCLGGEICQLGAAGAVELEGDAEGPQGLCITDPNLGKTGGDPEPDLDQIVRVCESGKTRCKGSDLERCQLFNGAVDWRYETSCMLGCSGGACIEEELTDGDIGEIEAEGLSCTPGEEQCYKNEIRECNKQGNAWTVTDPCANGTCIEDPPTAKCGPKLVCQPKQHICDKVDQSVVQICKDDGTGWSPYTCTNSQKCVDGLCQSTTGCTSGRYRCAGANVEKCSATGWQLQQACPQGSMCLCQQVVNGECVNAVCQAGAICKAYVDKRCNGTVAEWCGSDGAWHTNILEGDCAASDPPKTCQDGSCI